MGEYANAWQLIFNVDYKQQGFYRLWDAVFGEITKDMEKDLLTVATRGLY